jgi:hypothetical protein
MGLEVLWEKEELERASEKGQGKFCAKFENGIIELDLTVSSLLDDYVDSTRVLRSPEICADSAGGSLEKSKGEGSNRFKKWPVSS